MFSLTENYLTRGFWGDEAWTSLISQLPYWQMLKTTAADFHPPGYYTVVELWYKFLPTTEVSTRIVSIIFYFLTVFVVYKLASLISTSEESKLTSEVNVEKTEESEHTDSAEITAEALKVSKKRRFWGLVSALVVAVNPIFFTYAFEARNYTMFAFAATGSIYFLVRLSKSLSTSESSTMSSDESESKPFDSARGEPTSEVKRWVGDAIFFILFSTLGIYTHYYMFFVLAAQGLYLLLFAPKILLKMLWLYGAVAFLYLPWIPFLSSQVASVGQSYWISPIDGRTHFEALLRILGGEFANDFRWWLFGLSTLLLINGLIQSFGKKSFEKPYILLWLWATVPFILATLPGLTIDGVKLPFRPIFFWRYLIPAAVPLSMVMVHVAQKLPGMVARGSMVAVIVLAVAIDLWTFGRTPLTFKQVFEKEIMPKIEGDDKLVTVLPSFAEVLYYRSRNGLKNELVVLPEGIVQFSGKSLLDAYVEMGVVRIDDQIEGGHFELRPGPNVAIAK